jgi:multiple sugar transport system ATP-binding protein
MNFLSGSIGRASGPTARIENDAIPLDCCPCSSSLADGQEIVFGIRPEHVSPANDATRSPLIEVETLFIEPMGADTLAWFQYGAQRISARLTPQRARGLTGKVRLTLDMSQVSLFDPTTEERL